MHRNRAKRQNGEHALRAQQQSGFSLVEVLFGVGILSVILTGLIGFLVQFISLNKLSRDIALATSHAYYVMEEIRGSSGVLVDQITAGQWDFDTDGEFTTAGLMRLDEEIIDVSHDNGSPLMITVNIGWNNNGRPVGYTFYTIDAGI